MRSCFARLALNTALTHTDASAGTRGRRLVYGGHVIALAAGHVTRVLPDLATVLARRSCDHTGPTFQRDLLRTVVTIERLEPLADGGLIHFPARTVALSPGDDVEQDVLDWSAVGWCHAYETYVPRNSDWSSDFDGSAFRCRTAGGMTLAQLGADVIRFVDIGGGLDYQRWPLAEGGQSLFWAGMNKGKPSVTVSLRTEAGRELVATLIEGAGNLITNFPARLAVLRRAA